MTTITEQVNISMDPEAIPEYAYRFGAKILGRMIRDAFKDPEFRAEYEEWLKDYKKNKELQNEERDNLR
ncbi:MAG: hypothetical protein IJH11_03575 [Lachnospiraceae bacterium]|nr:hypothetical protein [Lachnospiraceae bacterium]